MHYTYYDPDKTADTDIKRYFLTYFIPIGIIFDAIICLLPIPLFYIELGAIPFVLFIVAFTQQLTEFDKDLSKNGMFVSCTFTKLSLFCFCFALALPLFFLNHATLMHQYPHHNENSIAVLTSTIVVLIAIGVWKMKVESI